MKQASRTVPLNKRGLNFEMVMWLFTRVSALAMYGLALVALVGALVMGARTQMSFATLMRWTFVPNITHVQNGMSADVTDLSGWMTGFWRVIASLMVMVATAHGTHGLVVIADDYISSARGRSLVRMISIAAILSVTILGVFVIWTS